MRYVLLILALLVTLGATACGGSPQAVVTVTATPSDSAEPISADAEQDRERGVKEAIHSLQIGVLSYGVDYDEQYPQPELLNELDMGSYVDPWPTNPYADEPMTQSTAPGSFTYELSESGTDFTITGYGGDGQPVIVATAATVTVPDVQKSAGAEAVLDAPSGIVALPLYGSELIVELTLIDPDTGTATPWRTFDVSSAGISSSGLPLLRLERFPQTVEDYFGVLGHSMRRYVFSQDYSRIAATATAGDDGSWHVGWLTAGGAFVDVTAKVHAGQSDFADAPLDTGPSFGMDDLFYWYDKNESAYKRVDPSNIDPSAVEVVSKDEVFRAFGLKNLGGKEGRSAHYAVYVSDRGLYATDGSVFADWIDGERYVTDGGPAIGVAVATASPTADARKAKDIVPTSNRINWNPIVNPAGDLVAFLSSNRNQPAIELFVVPVSGGDPTRVDTSYDFVQSDQPLELYDEDPGVYTLLDWL